jgi:hypothetical protein
MYLFIYLFCFYFLFQKDYSFFNMFYKKNCIFVRLDAGPPVFPKDPIYSQQVQWAGVCHGHPALPLPYLSPQTDKTI